MPGGWSVIDSDSQKVHDLAVWIIKSYFHLQIPPDYFIIYSEEQVVAGMNYKICMDIFFAPGNEIWEFIVYDRFGTYFKITTARKLSL